MPIKRRGNSWQVDKLVNGQRIRRQFPSAVEAEAYERSGTQDDKVTRSLGELFSVVLSSDWSSNKTTFMADMARMVIDHFGYSTPIEKISQEAILKYVTELKGAGLANATVNRRLAALSALLNHALDLGWIKARPKTKQLKEPKGRTRYLSDEEEAELIAKARVKDSRVADCMTFLVDTGMRVSEALGLRWRDIHGKMATIHNTKNGDSRSVPMTKRVVKLLESFDKEGDGPFCTLNRFRVSDVCQWARERTSMKGDREVVPHTLRHTCASRLVRRGAPIFMVKEWLGHKSLVMVQRYAHLSPEVLTDYVKLLDK